jgi:hypothetical protein
MKSRPPNIMASARRFSQNLRRRRGRSQ